MGCLGLFLTSPGWFVKQNVAKKILLPSSPDSVTLTGTVVAPLRPRAGFASAQGRHLPINYVGSGEAVNMEDQTRFLAVRAAEQGFMVFPLHGIRQDGKCTCKQAGCSSPGKHPRTKDGFKSATRNPTKVAKWFNRWPDSNYGIATGSGLAVIDVDGSAGEDSLEDLQELLGEALPAGGEVQTGKGRHYYYRCSAELPSSAGALGTGLDIRCEGGYVVGPGSRHVSGCNYEADPGADPLEIGFDHLPKLNGPWVEALQKPAKPAAPEAQKPHAKTTIPEGERDSTLFKIGCWLRHYSASAEEILVFLRQRNAERCDPPLPDKDIDRIARSAAKPAPNREIPLPGKMEAATPGVDFATLDFISNSLHLHEKEVPPTNWIVPGLIVQGLTILGGRPKAGKSWMSLQIALSVGKGYPIFGHWPCEPKKCLYLGLEDYERRIKDRQNKQLDDDEPRSPLTELAFDWPQGDEAVALLDRYFTERPDSQLAIIDTLQTFRGISPKESYAHDYDAMGKLQSVAKKHNRGILVVHHIRKASAEHQTDRLSGTNAIPGACDAIWTLDRDDGATYGRLFTTGRELDMQDMAMEFDKQDCLWIYKGDAKQLALSVNQRKVLDAFKHFHGEATPKELREYTDLKGPYVNKLLKELEEAKEIHRHGHGKWRLTAKEFDVGM